MGEAASADLQGDNQQQAFVDDVKKQMGETVTSYVSQLF